MEADRNKQSHGRSGVQEIYSESNQRGHEGGGGQGQNESRIALCPLNSACCVKELVSTTGINNM